MKNEAFVPAENLSLPVPEGTVSGEPVKIGALVGVAATNRGEGGNIATHASVLLGGTRAYLIDVDGAIEGVGTPVYITDNRTLTVTGGEDGDLFGHTVCAADGQYTTKGSGVGPALVKPLTV